MPRSISALFKSDPQRFSHFSLNFLDILFDFSKQNVDANTLLALKALAEASDLKNKIEQLFRGDMVNASEKRPVLHWGLRDPTTTSLMIEGINFKAEVHHQLDRMAVLVENIRAGNYRGATQETIEDILCLGIGGSALGPQMVCHALAAYAESPFLRCHFISNLDGQTIASTLSRLNPAKTLCLISSKTFTTLETLENAKVIRAWFQNGLRAKTNITPHLIAITANVQEAKTFGIPEENIFEFWPAIGGRFSLWSTVGLPIALSIGMKNFKDFLSGAYAMDQHFQSAPFLENMPVLLGLLGIWNINILNYSSHAFIPYDDALSLLPAYLQQLEMESNGKAAVHQTAPIIWGGVGCDAQHAYLQLLHQGTSIVPIDFWVATEGHPDFQSHQAALVANCLTQSKALMEGTQPDPSILPESMRYCAGNRPSTTLMYKRLTPKILGSLLALYEHKVFVQGVIWGINSFDQWGVELGKQWVKKILPIVEGERGHTPLVLDSSTQGLIDYYQRYI